MLKLRLADIQIPANRQRREFDPEKLQDLATSIERSGLMHAPVVRPTADGAGYALVAGERRLRAIKDYVWPTGGKLSYAGELFPDGEVPVVPLGELDELAAEEAELDENIKRVDLTWQERASAVERLRGLRSKQAVLSGGPAPTPATIAAETFLPKREGFESGATGHGVETTRKQLIVAQHLSNPEVAKAKSLDDAFKVLKRQEATRRNVALAAEVGKTYNVDQQSAYHADSLAWMQAFEGEKFDVILTDPPYGMGADEFGDSDGKAHGAHGYVDDWDSTAKLLEAFCKISISVTKPQAHAYVFCDFDGFPFLREWMTVAGWWVHRTPLIWHKPSAQRVPWPEHGPQRKWETILYAVKGKKPTTHVFPDLVSYHPDDNMGHRAQKPVALFIDLLKRSVQPGNRILDPFAGSGPIFPAAHELKCLAVGIEKDAGSYGLCLKRLEQLKSQQELGL